MTRDKMRPIAPGGILREQLDELSMSRTRSPPLRLERLAVLACGRWLAVHQP